MTANLPPHSRSGRLRRTARTTVAALSLLVVTAMSALAGPAAYAATPTPSPTISDEPEMSVVLAPENYGAYTPGTPFSAALSVGNEGDVPLPAGSVALEIGRTPISDRGALVAWIEDDNADLDLDPLTTAATPEVSVDDRESTSLMIPGAMLGQLGPGVYPLRATVSLAASDNSEIVEESARSVLVVSAAEAAATPVSVIVPITAAPAGSILSAQELATLTASDGTLTAQLDALAGTSAIIAIDPAIIAAVRALGTAAPATATAWLQRLGSLPNDIFLLQFADADVTAQIAGGLTEPLKPTTLDPFIDLNGLTPLDDDSETASPTPTPTEAPDAPELPTVDELTALSGARENFFWPRGSILNDELAGLSRVATPMGAPATVLPSSSFTEGENAGFMAPRVDVNGAIALVIDTPLSASLSRAVGEADALRRSAALAEVQALRFYLGGASQVLVGLDRNTARPHDALRDSLATVTNVQARTLSELLTTPPQLATLTSQSDAARAGAITPLLEDEHSLDEFSSILLDPAQLTARERISILQLLAVGSHTTDDAFEAAFAKHRTATRDTLNAVGIQPSNPILISAAVDVPVWVRNDLPYPISVRLDALPSDARLEVQRTTDVEALASSTTRVKIPVKARIASGEVNLMLSLRSHTGVPIGSSQVATMTVRAEWETIGLISFGSLAVLLIGAGIFRTIHKRRTDAAARSIDDSESILDEDAPSQP